MVREQIKSVTGKVAKEIKVIQMEVLKSLITLVTAAFGFVAAFAWNETIKTMFLQYYGEAGGFGSKFAYAILVSAIAVVVTVWLGRISGRMKTEDPKAAEVAKK